YYLSTTSSQNNKDEKNIVRGQKIENQIVREKDGQKAEVQNPASGITNRASEVSHTSSSEKVVSNKVAAENKAVAEKAEAPVVSKIENNNPVPEQPKVQDAAAAPAISIVKTSFRADANKVCENTLVKFTADNNEVACTYKWNFGDGGTSAEQNPQHIYSKAGNYSVKLQVASLKDKGSDELTMKNMMTVNPAPEVDFSYTLSEENKLIANFDGSADKITDWKWDFGDKKSSSDENPTHSFLKYATYKVTATAKNNNGCVASITKDVVVKNEINLLAPDAFSPNGDGLNDTWMPVALQSGDYEFTLTIYDKTNSVVFTTSDKNNSWNGANTKGGDTYSWKAVVKEKNGMQSNYQGVIVIRMK
ncbi:MAG TPA: PKD domain-containing protein, partial [Bacteroidia bacterium]